MFQSFLELLYVFLFGYFFAIIFTHEDDDISVSLLLPVLISELFLSAVIIYMRTESWWGGAAAAEAIMGAIKDNWYYALFGFIVFWAEQFLSTLFDLYVEDESPVTQTPRLTKKSNPLMGTSSSNFEDKSLDINSVTIVRLTHLAFGHLDRQVFASIEANLNIRPNQRKNVQRLLAETVDQKPSVADALRSLQKMSQGRHNAAYGIFDKLCMIATESKRYNKATLNNLISIAQQLGLSQEEIYYLFQKSRLAI